jgi:FKBP-type peptidyl-prolyl cis-trans isomerase 2
MAEKGSIAIIHFIGRLADDRPDAVFDTSDVDVALEEGIYHAHRDYAPVEFQVGDGTVLPGIDNAVRDMNEGDTQTVYLDPEDAFGSRHDKRVVDISRAELEARNDATATEGELVGSETGETGWITGVTNDTVEIDFNHELAGEPVEFEIRLLNVYDTRTKSDE